LKVILIMMIIDIMHESNKFNESEREVPILSDSGIGMRANP